MVKKPAKAKTLKDRQRRPERREAHRKCVNDAFVYAEVILVAPHVVLWPGIALATTELALQLVGDGLRDLLDVRAPRQPIVAS
jgi:hypothetical protein